MTDLDGPVRDSASVASDGRRSSSMSPSADFQLLTFPPSSESTKIDSGNGNELKVSQTTAASYAKVGAAEFERTAPLSADQFDSMFDKEGRLVNESKLRTDVFLGGVHPSIRRDVWAFLFGFYQAQSTKTERQLVLSRKRHRYAALVRRWKSIIAERHPNYNFNEVDSHFDLADDAESSTETRRTSSIIGQLIHPDSNRNLVDQRDTESQKPRPEKTAKSSNMTEMFPKETSSATPDDLSESVTKLEAEIFAKRLPYKQSAIEESLHAIVKDVPRTDRTHPLFCDDHCPGLLHLRDGLMAFCLLEPKLGYVQGMNDILARFLVVFGLDPFAFWCFHQYIVSLEDEYKSVSMMQRILALQNLLSVVDADLYHYLHVCGAQDLLFCHRWLLLSFQREFSYDDGLHIMEVLGSQHLELNSTFGEQMREKIRRAQSNRTGDQYSVDFPEAAFSFNLFVAAAILTLHRNAIFNCVDASQVHQTVSGLSGRIDLNATLIEAQRLFRSYCHVSVLDAFVIV